MSGSFTLLKDNALGFDFPTQNLTPLAGFIVCDMSSRVSYWWVIWGELQGYGDPIHGQGTRESWRETFSKPSPSLPLTPSSWCIQPKGERHRLHCDLQPLHCSCTPYASAHLQLGSHSRYFNFRFQVQFTTSSRRLDGGAYCGAPVGGKCMVSKAKLVLFAFAV